jgi:hypothetical protein
VRPAGMRRVEFPFSFYSGRLAASYQRTHIGPYTLDLASSFRSAAEMAGLEFTVESTLPGNFVVWIDREKYENIFYNLLSNVSPTRLVSARAETTRRRSSIRRRALCGSPRP